MAIYKVQGPDGRVHRFEGPDGASQDEVMAFAQQAFGGQQAAEQPEQEQFIGTPGGKFEAALTGFNSMVPFGNKITSALGAAGAKAFGVDESFGDLYRQAMANSEATKEAHPGYYAGGAVAGIAPALAVGLPAKALTGTVATTGARGAINAIPGAISQVGNFVRGGPPAATALGRAGQLALRAGKGAVVAAPISALYGAGEAPVGEELDGAIGGAGLGATLGAALPVAGAVGGKAIRGVKEAVAPTLDRATAELAAQAQKMGIPLRLDQISPTRFRNTVQKVSQEIPFSGVDAFEDSQRRIWNKALANTIGETADDLSPTTINNFLQRSSNTFDGLVSGKNVAVSPVDIQDISALRNQVDNTLGLTSRDAKILKTEIDGLVKDLGQGAVDGQKLSAIRSDLLKKSTGSTIGKEIFSDILDKVDDIAKRSLSPDEVKKLTVARREWRNFKTIEPLLEGATDGMINPTALMNRVKGSKYVKASRAAVGDDELVDLARIGKEFMPKKGGSDTFQKSALFGGGALGGAGMLANTVGTLSAAVAAPLANRGLQAANQSQSLVRKSIQKSLTPQQLNYVMTQLPPREAMSVLKYYGIGNISGSAQ